MSDNSFLDSKIKLRRYFLDLFHTDGQIDLLETHQGGGVLWDRLKKIYPLRSRLGIDKKFIKGRLRMDSARYLMNGITQNVIDIDAYGSPFLHYEALLANSVGEKTIFLTSGHGMGKGMSVMSHQQVRALGLWPAVKYLSASMQGPLGALAENQMLFGFPEKFGWTILKLAESSPGLNARYFGARIKKT